MKKTSINAEERFAIEELLAHYMDTVDKPDLEHWVELFAESAAYQVITQENLDNGYAISHILDDSKDRIRDRVTYVNGIWGENVNSYTQRHTSGPASIKLAPDTTGEFEVTMNIAVHMTSNNGRGTSMVVGRYVDRVISDGGAMAFKSKQVILDTVVLQVPLVFPL